MKEYKFTFNGRKVGAIGITYHITHIVKADSLEAAKLKLYAHFEHITNLKQK